MWNENFNSDKKCFQWNYEQCQLVEFGGFVEFGFEFGVVGYWSWEGDFIVYLFCNVFFYSLFEFLKRMYL